MQMKSKRTTIAIFKEATGSAEEDALDHLFFRLCPDNEDMSAVLLKVSVLNDFYSTNIFKVYPVAKRILSLHIDDRLQHGDSTLVDDIKEVMISGKTRNHYSFATKYCSHHKPLDYPIYDSYVDEVLNSVYTSYARMFAQMAMQRTKTAAMNPSLVFA